MAKIINTWLILFLLVVTIMNGSYSVEATARGNKLEKNDSVHKSQKFGKMIDCMILHHNCLVYPYLWPLYYMFCSL
ncbi:unnamed protein product [Lathyrus sativus]|nr:unnamed protein product [Lathyrus sativus]